MPEEPFQTPEVIVSNVEKIVRAEEEQISRASVAIKLVNKLGMLIGTLQFLTCQIVFFVAWVIWNVGVFPFLTVFDPMPFPLFDMIVAAEAVILTVIIVIRQNRMAEIADRRAHLALQINLLAEREVTVMLQMQRAVCQRLGVTPDEAAHEYTQPMDVEKLANFIGEKLDD
jgi:uncharacterized membrane protein